MAKYMKTVQIGYTFADSSKTFVNESNPNKGQIRTALWSKLHDEYTTKTGTVVFDTKPGWTDLRSKLNEKLFTGTNSENLIIPWDTDADGEADKKGGPTQSHVFVNGAWVCETRFQIHTAATPHQPLTDAIKIPSGDGGVDFDVWYWVGLFDYHEAP
jgi:hypothetical protein